MILSGKRVLVTGARGFIGAHLVRRARRLGAEVHAVSRRDGSATGITWWRCDLGQREATALLMRAVAPDIVFHLASEVAGARDQDLVMPMFQANLASVVHLLGAAAELPDTRVVLAGSIEEPALGEPPSSPYAAAKSAASGYARMYHELWQLPVTTLRVAMVYGPDQPDRRKLVPYVVTSLLDRRVPELASGAREVDWIYVDDVVDAFVAAATTSAAAGASLEIGSGVAVSIRDVVSGLVALTDNGVRPSFGAVADRPLDSARIADPAPAAAVLGWRPSVSLDDGLARTVRWYAEDRRAG